MGSVIPKGRDTLYALSLFREIQRQIEAARETGSEADRPHIAELIADAIAHPDSRHAVLLALSDFVVESMSGATPDLRFWTPPKP